MPESGWERLGRYVVARRVELGIRRREEFAQALGISPRTVGDIETGRRGRFDPTTIASLENVLGWETGSAVRITEGGEPALRPSTQGSSLTPPRFLAVEHERDAAIVRVMQSSISEDKKRSIIAMLLAQKEADERRREEQADRLIQFVKDGA